MVKMVRGKRARRGPRARDAARPPPRVQVHKACVDI